MADNEKRKCFKCGCSPSEDPTIKLYRFPNPGPTNVLRCESWARYCFPDREWSALPFQRKLYVEHRMLCSKHFKKSSFTDFAEKKLNRHAVPDIECDEHQQVVDISVVHQAEPVPGPSHQVIKTGSMPGLQLAIDYVAETGPSYSTTEPKPRTSQILMDMTNILKQSQPHQVIDDSLVEQSEPSLSAAEPKPGPSKILIDITNIPKQAKVVPLHNNDGTKNQTMTIGKKEKSQKENKLFMKCRKQMKKICRLHNAIKHMKQKATLNILSDNKSVTKLMKKLTPSFALMLQAQLKNANRKYKGRRWSIQEKIIALRLYKKSPTCYRLLRRLWCLPAPSTLKSLLRQFELHVGINQKVFDALKQYAKSQQPSDNTFILMFDEMSIKKHLYYNRKEDKIEGYQDHGPQQGRTQQEVTHALVFMVAGIRKKVKQPVAYYLSSSYVTADRLSVLIKEVLRNCFNAGLNISATVCDMDGVNRRALAILGANKEHPYFVMNHKEVVTIFDAPHLLKCFRNLFLKYNIKCQTNITSNEFKGQGIAKWSHIQDFYEMDNRNPNFVFAPALRKEHLNPNAKQKMRVNLAAQVMSHSVAAGMYAKISQGELTTEAAVTAEVLSNMDKLFDCLNGDRPDLKRGKIHATNMSQTSPHLKFFGTMKTFFANLEYVGGQRLPPSQQGWMWTINAVERLWNNLKNQQGIKSLATRRLQQDPLENLFGCIRGNCGSNSNPTTGQFVAGMKTAILSNLAHMGHGNCEKDDAEAIMKSFKKILSTDINSASTLETPLVSVMLTSIENSLEEGMTEENTGEMQACAYICGFLLKYFKNQCETCFSILATQQTIDMHIFCEFKEYDELKKRLKYASKELVECVERCATLINKIANSEGHVLNLKRTIYEKCLSQVNFAFLNRCAPHYDSNVKDIINCVFHICIKRFCILKNRQYAEAASALALRKKIDILKHK